jgi:retron-type reverse transcriptase
MQVEEPTLEQVCDWGNLLSAWHQAAQGKRGKPGVAAFEHQVADRLLDLQARLSDGTWQPGPYVHFTLDGPKRRLISAAPFADRVVHHALCNAIEPVFERLFIPDSYANRVGKGTHAAVDRVQALARRYRYVLRLDIVQHFPSIDHAVLLETLGRRLRDQRVLELVRRIVASGDGIREQGYRMVRFPGDDLLAACRPRGLPIGNLTSQFWSNCFLHPLDQLVTRGLGCAGYCRYVDDMALFGDSKARLWAWKAALVGRLAGLRLTVHPGSAQVARSAAGIPWLGFVIYPEKRLVKARKTVESTRRLSACFDAWRAGETSFARFDAAVRGWVNHVRYADTWGLRERVLSRLVW